MKNNDKSDALVLVTGGTRGLGLEIVRRLFSEGYRVVAAARNPSDLLTELISKSNNRIYYEMLDLSKISGLHDTINKIVKSHGPLYGLINNGAIANSGILATMHDSQIQEVLLTNVTGTIVLTKYAIRSMLLQRQGRVINIASIIASTGFNGLSVYGASKAALLGFTRSLSREVGRAGVTVNTVSPGYMETHMSAGLEQSQLDTIRRRSPMKKLVTTRDAAGAVAYFLSDDAAHITGTELTVDAGSTA